MSSHASTLSAPVETGGAPTARSAAHWARDFAVVGAVSSFLAPFLISGTLLGWGTLLVTTAAGGLTGALLGALLRRPLQGSLGATPWPLLTLLMGALGGLWGAVVGAIGGTALRVGTGGDLLEWGRLDSGIMMTFMGYAALAAALQLAWFGTAYQRAERAAAPTWPLLLAACGTPFLGWAALRFLVFVTYSGMRW